MAKAATGRGSAVGGSGPRVAVGGLVHESNAFSAVPTRRSNFFEVRPEKLFRAFEGTSSEIAGFLDVCRSAATEIVPVGFAYAGSSGLVDHDVATALVDELVERVAGAEADVVLLALHGSMAADGIDDVEGRLASRLRAELGEAPVVAFTLDWHCSITAEMVEGTDLLVGYRTYPHIDQRTRAVTAARLALAQCRGEVVATAASCHPPMVIAGPRTSHGAEPMRSVLAGAHALAADLPSLLDWSLCPGFARSDVAQAGVHAYVVTDGDPDGAASLARDLAGLAWDQRRAFVPALATVDDAVATALAADRHPVVLSDQGDNPGGGAPGDGTVLLGALVAAGAEGAVVGSLCDPEVVELAAGAGVGATVAVALGGKADDRHGPPLHVDATVTHLSDGVYTMRSPTHDGVRRSIGPTATLAVGGVQVVVTSTPVQNEDLELFELVGVDMRASTVVVVKSNAHFRAAFEPVAAAVIDVDTPGLSTPHLKRLPFRRLARPVFPSTIRSGLDRRVKRS